MDKSAKDIAFTEGEIKKLCHGIGVDRVSKDAAIYMGVVAEDKMRVLARASQDIAHNADRKTVKEDDVRLASKIIEGDY